LAFTNTDAMRCVYDESDFPILWLVSLYPTPPYSLPTYLLYIPIILIISLPPDMASHKGLGMNEIVASIRRTN
jgi:hypothetical protein